MENSPSGELWGSLAVPFAAQEIKLRVIAFNRDKTRGLVVPYVDARAIMKRLDAVAGVGGWSDGYDVIGTSSDRVCVRCTLVVQNTTKQDFGAGDDYKAACSDALKRAAVKFGIARELYDAPRIWAALGERGVILDEGAVRLQIVPRSNEHPLTLSRQVAQPLLKKNGVR